METQSRIGLFAITAALLQALLFFIYIGFVRYDTFYDGTIWNQTKQQGHDTPTLRDYYPMFQDVHVMIAIGFGFLMTFLKKYGYSAVGLNLLLMAITIQLSIVIDGIIKSRGGIIRLNIISILNADFACAAILISYGAVLGKTSPVQLLFMAIIETVMFVINAFICVELLGIADIGGSIVIHIFGAYFGLAFSRTVCRKTEHNDHIHEASSPISDLFSMIGTLFLWVYWPSFNAALGSDSGIGRAVINTYLGLVAATVAAFITSSWASGKNQWSMVHIQNATLAGGVAVGAVADQMIMPWGALFLGSLAGLVSTIGYIYLQPLLNQKISLHDTCGVHNLHGMPGIISALASIGTALAASETLYGQDLYVHYPLLSPPANSTAYQRLYEMDSQIAPGTGRTPRQQALCQFLGMLVTLSLSIISGALTGLGLSCSTVFEPLIRHQLFNDDTYWELPDEDETVIMTESKTSEFVEQPKIFSMKSLPDAS